MGCCGQKRAQLLHRQAPAGPPEDVGGVETRTEPKRAPRIFEYTGNDTVTLRGAASGRTYRFAGRGDCVEVAYEDTFAMLAEQEVRQKGGASHRRP